MRFREQSQQLFEREVANDRFSLTTVFKHLTMVEESEEPLEIYRRLQAKLGARATTSVLQNVLRWVFFIELVKEPAIDSTKFALRWSATLEGRDDPRFCSYVECLKIFESLLEQLDATLQNEEESDTALELLRAFEKRRLLPYELPLDYRERRSQEKSQGRIHAEGNLAWMWGASARRTVVLREFLLGDKTDTQFKVFAAAYDKIKVKTYLTDRVLTGDYKTNREKRWEVHPSSVHFALRRWCWEIETRLIEQICHFDGFPADLARRLEDASLITWGERPFRCPITLEPLSFEAFAREVTQPTHGRSSFQVGHLNPLKAAPGEEVFGHTAPNVSWVSSDGNRIQGALSLEETRQLIRRVADNYRRFSLE